jgi:hypothetical protein
LPKVQFFIALTNQLQNRRSGIRFKAEMLHLRTFCGREAGMPVLHFLTILYEDDHDLLCRLIRNQNIRLPLEGD